jgi:hypothetical protein
VEIFSVSKRYEHLAQAPAAAFVITSEDIQRSGATTLQEALRLAPNLQVARSNARNYAISARGFNNIFANDFSEVNIGLLQKAIDEKRLKVDGKITEEVLRKAGLAHKSRDGVRLLGKGAITAKVDIEVAGVSAGARAAVEKAGGSVTTTFQKKVYSNKKGEPGKRQKRRADAAAKRTARQG